MREMLQRQTPMRFHSDHYELLEKCVHGIVSKNSTEIIERSRNMSFMLTEIMNGLRTKITKVKDILLHRVVTENKKKTTHN